MLYLDPGETILYEVRRHWIVIFAYGFILGILAILPSFFLGIISDYVKSSIQIPGEIWILVFFGYLLWLLILWVLFFIQWTNYYLDVWYITEKRIIDIEQMTLFHREISNLPFDKIQDVTINVRGLIATFLRFGDIRVQTAAEHSSDYIMRKVANPDKVRQIIFEQHNKQIERIQEVKIVDKQTQ